MKFIYTYLFIYLSVFFQAQTNLVLNPSFEDTVSCNSTYLSIDKCENWYRPSNTTSDYYNICVNSKVAPNYYTLSTIPQNCEGYSYPRTGNAFAGITIYDVQSSDSNKIYSEFISTQLSQKLISNKCYYVEFYASLSDVSGVAVNRLGCYLSQATFTTSFGTYTNTIQPQIEFDTTQYFIDTLNWVKISGYYLAQGNEEYLTIGNFRDGNHTRKIKLSTNFSNMCSGGQDYVSYVYIDDVVLYACTDVGIEKLENDHSVVVYPNPANTEVYVNMRGYEELTMMVYNVMGDLVLQKAVSNKQSIDLKIFSPGTYIYRLYSGANAVGFGKLMISK